MEHHLFYGVHETQAYKNNKYSFELTQAAYANQDTIWCLDSSSSSHLTKNIDDLNDTCSVETGKLHLANNASTDIKARGNVHIQVSLGQKTKRVELTNALHVPDLRTNLMSVDKITDKGYRVIFEKDSADVVNEYGETILTADRVDELYHIKAERTNALIASSDTKKQESSNLESSSLWHRRMGHLNMKDLVLASQKKTIEGIGVIESKGDITCEVCIQGKMSRAAFPKHSERSTKILDLVHSDVCGPMHTESHGRAKYFVTFIDDHSGWCEVRFLNKKNEVFAEFKKVRAFFEKQTGESLKCLQSDNGTEYLNNAFNDFMNSNGIRRRLTVANNPEQNGKAERRNRTLLEMAVSTHPVRAAKFFLGRGDHDCKLH